MPFDFRASPVRKRVWTVGRLLLLTLALAVTYGLFFLTAMRVATRAREVKVPDIRGKSLADARTALSDVGLEIRVDDARKVEPKVPADHVVTQEPDPGTVLRRQRSVRVRLSEGQREPVIPAVAGQPERTAELRMAEERIAIASRAEIRSTDYPAGVVVGQDPLPKGRGATVTLLVNRGEGGQSYVVPDLIGTPGARVVEVLRTFGFRAAIAAEVSYPGIPAGTVVRQTPQAGYQIAPGQTISIEVSR